MGDSKFDFNNSGNSHSGYVRGDKKRKQLWAIRTQL